MNSPDNISHQNTSLCVIGDTHGHLQLALCVAARWQQILNTPFDAVLLCGDVGTFTDESQLDSTTRRHARSNPCELEFLYQWSVTPQPHWLARIFTPTTQNGLGLTCPVVMVHGNHEGFTHLAGLITDPVPAETIPISNLPAVDSAGYIRYLPSGWKCHTRSGITIGGIGGIESGRRRAGYHDLAYINDQAVLHLLDSDPFDILITHQGPQVNQGEHGASILDLIADTEICRYWFHGHSTPNMAIEKFGPNLNTQIIPLGDIAFPAKRNTPDVPGDNGWCRLTLGSDETITRERPGFWRDFRKSKWRTLPNGQLLSPSLSDTLRQGNTSQHTKP